MCLMIYMYGTKQQQRIIGEDISESLSISMLEQ